MSIEDQHELGLDEEVKQAIYAAISQVEILRGVKFRLESKTLDSLLQVFVSKEDREKPAGYALCYPKFIEFCTDGIKPTYFLTITPQGFSLEHIIGENTPEKLSSIDGLQNIFNEMVDNALKAFSN